MPAQPATATTGSGTGYSRPRAPVSIRNVTICVTPNSNPALASNCAAVSSDGDLSPFSNADSVGRDVPARTASSPWLKPDARRAPSSNVPPCIAYTAPVMSFTGRTYPIEYPPPTGAASATLAVGVCSRPSLRSKVVAPSDRRREPVQCQTNRRTVLDQCYRGAKTRHQFESSAQVKDPTPTTRSVYLACNSPSDTVKWL